MKYEEIKGNLFTVDKKYFLAHCIASDAIMGAGIAVDFCKKFPKIKSLRKTKNDVGSCVLIDRVFNLITKKISSEKPTYETFQSSLINCKNQCITNDIKFLAMPKIGCGLDGLQWEIVKIMINNTFKNLDIDIKVYVI